MRTSISLLALSVLAACVDPTRTAAEDRTPAPSSGTGGIWAGFVRADASRDGITIANSTERPVGYFISERETLAVLNWRPCTPSASGPACPTVIQGERKLVPWKDVVGARDERKQYVVFWWHLVAGRNGALQPDSMRTITVER